MYRGYLLDLDGTIYLGDKVIPAGKRFIERLQQQHIPYLLVTNNSSRLPSEVVHRLKTNFDIEVQESEVYTSSMATAEYLDELNRGKKVYFIGQDGLKHMLIKYGYHIVDSHCDYPDYVVVGLDQQLTYEKLKEASLSILQGAQFIGTNPDRNIPTHEGLFPSAGPTLSYLETATQVTPTIIGKPNAIMMDHAVSHLGVSKDEVVMVGDNYETDIKAGLNNHIPSLLVLSGFTKKEDIPHLEEMPTHIVDSLDDWKL